MGAMPEELALCFFDLFGGEEVDVGKMIGIRAAPPPG
jgi:hypothetical protein